LAAELEGNYSTALKIYETATDKVRGGGRKEEGGRRGRWREEKEWRKVKEGRKGKEALAAELEGNYSTALKIYETATDKVLGREGKGGRGKKEERKVWEGEGKGEGRRKG
jgi:hypothetical protein